MDQRFTVSAIEAFSDNYIWLIERSGCLDAIVVDPGDPGPVFEALTRRGLSLRALLITHRHADHIGGIQALAHRYPGLEVYAPLSESIPHRTHPLREGDAVHFERLGLHFRVIEVPGHTAGHIAYYEARRRWLYCGDTLFLCGCGRVFDGTHAQLFESLMRIASLPEATQIYCAHEYTLDNIGFAQMAESGNANLDLYEAECRARRERGQPTVPGTLRRELKCNPFLRLGEAKIVAKAEAWSQNSQCPLSGLDPARPEDTFHLIRNWKDVAYD